MSTTDGPLANVTAAQVIAWGKAQPAEAVIGVCGSTTDDLICRYGRSALHITLSVHPSGASTERTRYAVSAGAYDLPDDLRALATGFDALWPDDGIRAHRHMHPADLDRLAVTP